MKLRELVGLPISSYDIIGDIAIIYIADEYLAKAEEIAKAIVSIHKRIKAVYRKNPIQGEYRTRELEHIYGEKRTETTTKENGIVLKLDVEKVFYSPRMATDRKIIANEAKDYENIFVPFAGVGPYPILIAKLHPNTKIIAVEKNREAIKYFKQNIILNKVKNIEIVEGDVLEVVDKYNNWADRIIMPLPKDSYNYLKELAKVAKNGAILYVYMFVDSSKAIEDGVEKIKKNLDYNFELIETRKLRGYSKSIDEYVFKIKLIKLI